MTIKNECIFRFNYDKKGEVFIYNRKKVDM